MGRIRDLNLGGCRILSPSAFPVRQTDRRSSSAGSADGPDLHLKAELRWLGTEPRGRPVRARDAEFVHAGDSAQQIEGMLKGVLKATPNGGRRSAPILREVRRRASRRSARRERRPPETCAGRSPPKDLDRLTSRGRGARPPTTSVLLLLFPDHLKSFPGASRPRQRVPHLLVLQQPR